MAEGVSAFSLTFCLSFPLFLSFSLFLPSLDLRLSDIRRYSVYYQVSVWLLVLCLSSDTMCFGHGGSAFCTMYSQRKLRKVIIWQ